MPRTTLLKFTLATSSRLPAMISLASAPSARSPSRIREESIAAVCLRVGTPLPADQECVATVELQAYV